MADDRTRHCGERRMKRMEIEELLTLARDKSVAGRNRLAATVGDLFGREGEPLTDRERALMTDILRRLIHDVEMSVRRTLGERLAQFDNVPRELIVTLANDEIEVAQPILMRSTLLQDSELVEIIHHRTMQHQLAIAMRGSVSEIVSDALVDNGHVDVIKTLVENRNARISRATMAYLVEQSKRVDAYQNPLVRHPDLPPDLAKQMVFWVSAALRQHIVENFELDETELDDRIDESISKTVDAIGAGNPQDTPEAKLAEKLAEGGVKPALLIQVLRRAEIPLFEALFARLTGLRGTLVRRILYEPGGEALAIACKSVDIQKNEFASIFLLSRKARPGENIVDPKELARVIAFYDRIKRDAALAVLKRWQRDPRYLDAQRRLSESG